MSCGASSSGYDSFAFKDEGADNKSNVADVSSSSSSDFDSDWEEEDWPSDRALPLPEWGTERPELTFENQRLFQRFLIKVKSVLTENISTFAYDTLSNFIQSVFSLY